MITVLVIVDRVFCKFRIVPLFFNRLKFGGKVTALLVMIQKTMYFFVSFCNTKSFTPKTFLRTKHHVRQKKPLEKIIGRIKIMNIDIILLNRFLIFKLFIATQALHFGKKNGPEEFVNDG